MLMMCVVFNFILGRRLLLLPVTFNIDVHILRFSVQYSRFSFRFRCQLTHPIPLNYSSQRLFIKFRRLSQNFLSQTVSSCSCRLSVRLSRAGGHLSSRAILFSAAAGRWMIPNDKEENDCVQWSPNLFLFFGDSFSVRCGGADPSARELQLNPFSRPYRCRLPRRSAKTTARTTFHVRGRYQRQRNSFSRSPWFCAVFHLLFTLFTTVVKSFFARLRSCCHGW